MEALVTRMELLEQAVLELIKQVKEDKSDTGRKTTKKRVKKSV